MTKKDYIKFASVISTRRESIKTSVLYGELTEEQALEHDKELTALRNLIAITCKNDNPSFNYDKFINACEK